MIVSPSISHQLSRLVDYERSIGELALNFPRRTVPPKVSIIIPIHNQFDYTARCLASIQRWTGGIDHEIIIVDDASDLAVYLALSALLGVKIVRNFKNQGFIHSCNRGAEHARGEFLLFLNNDTEVSDGWLDALLQVFETRADAGLVGAKLISSDGKLQEAGGIVWSDGSAWNYGRDDDPNKPEYNYLREADYCSGACIILRRRLFSDLGGFDIRYAPAYCEDSDLAFQIRSAGRKVYYQPAAVVVHHEGKSNGTNVAAGIKSYQVTNNFKFVEKWRAKLESEQYPNGVAVAKARERSRARKLVLFIDHYVPHYDRDAGSRTIWSYLEHFLDGDYSVKFIGDNFFDHQPYTKQMQQRGIEVLHGTWYQNNWEEWLRENGRLIDYVVLSRADVALKYLKTLRRYSGARLLFYGHDLVSRTLYRKHATTHDEEVRQLAREWQTMEEAVFGLVDVAYYPSPEEVEYLRQRYPSGRFKTLPPFVFKSPAQADYQSTLRLRSGLLFVGGFNHPPNADAILWFVAEVWPGLLSRFPALTLTIAGSNPPASILALAADNVRVTGYVSDQSLSDFYASHMIAIAPLRYGGGIKGKIVEALWHGLPVVTTPIGSEGIPECDRCMSVASIETYAQSLANALMTPEMLAVQVAEGARIIADYYSPMALQKIFAEDIQNQTDAHI